VEETQPAEQSGRPGDPTHGEPDVAVDVDGHTARLTLTGELTEAARRPVIRVVTDLLLGHPSLGRIELHLAGVPFMNSAGMAVLVQIERLVAPRAIDVPLVDPGPAVTRPLQLSGLWHRFTVEGPSAAS